MQYGVTYDGKKEKKNLLPGDSPCWKDPNWYRGAPVGKLIFHC